MICAGAFQDIVFAYALTPRPFWSASMRSARALGALENILCSLASKAWAVGLCLAKLSRRSTWRLVNRWRVTRAQHARAALTRVPHKPSSPGSCTPERCISYLTIEHRSAPAKWFENRSDDWLFGCDACVEACPHSQPSQRSARVKPNANYDARHSDFDLADVLQWTESSQAALKLSKALLRAKLSMWKRNALLIVSGTSPQSWSTQLVSALGRLQADATEDVWLREKSEQLLRLHSQSKI